jgi:hypothetical protein
VSIVTVVNPVPGDPVGGTSLAPLKTAKYEMGAAYATDPKSRQANRLICATLIEPPVRLYLDVGHLLLLN